ncbi:DUF1972 domain-containing protein [Anaeromyxobacter sp. SG17]|uniref:DUF1972 domain-containing protein n=1 Tax=Anaeromyxobacter sp. SG17 TaxID=2925405 RepID=UPI001F5799A9|nr:DUF1972 domain-containing protein [Anaeromyxobacter sp. SG17]
MKLAILGTRGIPARYGGFETFAEELAVRLAGAGIHVTVFCPSSTAKPDHVYRDVRLRFVVSNAPKPFDQLGWDVKCLSLCRGQYDVVYMLGTGGGFMAWVPRLFGAQVWMNTDGLEWRRSKWSFVGRAYLKLAEALSVIFANRVIADSEAIARYLRDRYGRLAVISTIAYGAPRLESIPDHSPLRRWGLVEGEYYIVVCRLEPENNLLELIEGFEASDCGRPLVILGNIDKPNRYVRQLLAHRGEHVRFIGTVFDPGVLRALRYHAAAYLHGHSVGGTNPSLLEAMACRNIVIAHDNPFNREVLRDSGLFFSTSSDVRRHIQRIERGGPDVKSMGTRAALIVAATYTWERVTAQYLALVRDASARSGAPLLRQDRRIAAFGLEAQHGAQDGSPAGSARTALNDSVSRTITATGGSTKGIPRRPMPRADHSGVSSDGGARVEDLRGTD